MTDMRLLVGGLTLRCWWGRLENALLGAGGEETLNLERKLRSFTNESPMTYLLCQIAICFFSLVFLPFP